MATTMVLTADEALELPAFLVTAARTVFLPPASLVSCTT
jgi:hypothetical protein